MFYAWNILKAFQWSNLKKFTQMKTSKGLLINYIITSVRSLRRNRVYALINYFGLTLGLSSVLFAFIAIQYEYSFDRFAESDNIYRVVLHKQDQAKMNYSSNVPYPMATAIRNEIQGAGKVTGFHYSEMEKVKYDNELRYVNNVVFADSEFFEVLNFEVLSGNPKRILNSPGQALITDEMSMVLFGEADPIGRIIKLADENIEIAGVVSSPTQTHLDFNLIVSYPTLSSQFTADFDAINSWSMVLSGYCYLKLPSNDNLQSVEKRLYQLVQKYHEGTEKENNNYYLQALNDIHFNKRYADPRISTVSKDYLLILSSVSLFIMIIACINFINLNTAMASRRAREAGVRKVLGARPGQLINQFVLESMILTLVSLLSAMFVTWLILPFYNTFMNKELVISFSDHTFLIGSTALFVIVSLLAGWYPAFMISQFKAIRALKSEYSSVTLKGAGLRKFLVSFQFVISQIMIIGTLIVFSQIEFIRNKDLGFDQDAIITAPLFSRDSTELRKLKSILLQHKDIKHVSFGLGAPTSNNDLGTSFTFTNKENLEEANIRLKTVDNDYMETYGLRLLAGQWLTSSTTWQSKKNEFVINESALNAMGIENPIDVIGQNIELGINHMSGPIIGVVQNFHVRSLHEEIPPTVMLYFPRLHYEAGLKISGLNVPETLETIESAWQSVYPDEILQYTFMDDLLDQFYIQDKKILLLFNIFSWTSIFIACLGLFGLIAFTIHQKMLEIGIRKVFGAKSLHIIWILSTRLLLLVCAATIISFPLAFVAMNRWLEGFAYRVDISPFYFILALLITLLITVGSVGYRAFKASIINPIRILRNE